MFIKSFLNKKKIENMEVKIGGIFTPPVSPHCIASTKNLFFLYLLPPYYFIGG